MKRYENLTNYDYLSEERKNVFEEFKSYCKNTYCSHCRFHNNAEVTECFEQYLEEEIE